MKLNAVLKGLNTTSSQESSNLEVSGVCQDSRVFKPGDIFVAIKGEKFDGHDFAVEAAARGASAVIVEINEWQKRIAVEGARRAVSSDQTSPTTFSRGAVLTVLDTRRALDVIASNYFGRPSEKLFTVGVTGTNGKTTTTHMIEAILNRGGLLTGVIGTIDSHLGAKKTESTHTTPEALQLQKQLSSWVNEGAKAVSLEVSSHALALNRVDSLEFDVGAFTNLTRDHLDFHKTIDNYVAAKARLFRQLLSHSKKTRKRAILNAEDSYSEELKPDDVPVWSFGFETGDIRAQKIRLSFEGSDFEALTPSGRFDVHLPMIGRHNIANSLCAIGVGLHAGISPAVIADGLSGLRGVAGRLQRVPTKSPVRVFVDYAHTDDALINVLGFLKELRDQTSPRSQLITVFGCGGDRDRGKRPMMLKAAQAYSDQVIVTSDNPRTEDPDKIIEDILTGRKPDSVNLKGTVALVVEPDRKKAIYNAIENAASADVILIAGKGHENYQIIGTQKIPFDDVTIAKEILGA